MIGNGRARRHWWVFGGTLVLPCWPLLILALTEVLAYSTAAWCRRRRRRRRCC